MNEDKQAICAKLGELLKLTHVGADIDRIEYDAQNDRAIIYRADRSGYLYRMCLNHTIGNSGIALIRNIVVII